MTGVTKPARRRWEPKLIAAGVGVLVLTLLVLVIVVIVVRKPLDDMYAALRPATAQERAAVKMLGYTMPNEQAALKDVRVATGDVKTTPVGKPMVIVLTRNQQNPMLVTRWLGGQLGEIILVFSSVSYNPYGSYGGLDGIAHGTVYYDWLCQLVPYGYATWQDCQDRHNRQPASMAEFRRGARQATAAEAQAWVEGDLAPQELQHWYAATGGVRLASSDSREYHQSIILANGAKVRGGDLGLGRLYSDLTARQPRFTIYDGLCEWFDRVEPAYRQVGADVFLPPGVVTHYRQSCPFHP